MQECERGSDFYPYARYQIQVIFFLEPAKKTHFVTGYKNLFRMRLSLWIIQL